MCQRPGLGAFLITLWRFFAVFVHIFVRIDFGHGLLLTNFRFRQSTVDTLNSFAFWLQQAPAKWLDWLILPKKTLIIWGKKSNFHTMRFAFWMCKSFMSTSSTYPISLFTHFHESKMLIDSTYKSGHHTMHQIQRPKKLLKLKSSKEKTSERKI